MADPIVVLARGWKVEIDSAGWVEVKGLLEIGLSPGSKEADITTKENAIYDDHLIARRSMDIQLKGFRLESTTGAVDPGQAAVEALSELVDYDSRREFQVTSPGGAVRNFYASATMDALGGQIDEGQTWGCKLKQAGDLIP